jgi:DNA-directed RNA polymerase specialized sigma24 family protein
VHPATLILARRLLAGHYGIPGSEIDDLVGEALADYVGAVRDRPSSDRLFLVIVQRRACDFCRRRRRRAAVESADVAAMPDYRKLENEMLEAMAGHFAQTRSRLNAGRVIGVVHAILEGASFAEGCRLSGIPRGSQGRYRAALRQCFDSLRQRTDAVGRRSRRTDLTR